MNEFEVSIEGAVAEIFFGLAIVVGDCAAQSPWKVSDERVVSFVDVLMHPSVDVAERISSMFGGEPVKLVEVESCLAKNDGDGNKVAEDVFGKVTGLSFEILDVENHIVDLVFS